MFELKYTELFAREDLTDIMNLIISGKVCGWWNKPNGGPYLQKFENKMKTVTGQKYAKAVSNGSTSIYLALRALGVQEGDVVMTTAYNHIGGLAPIIHNGSIPYFIDVDSYGNMDSLSFHRAIEEPFEGHLKLFGSPNIGFTNNPKVTAVIVTHEVGMPCKGIKQIVKKAHDNDMTVIEDCSQALGADIDGIPVGSFGDVACYSTGGDMTKMITTGEGGVITTDISYIADAVDNLRNHGDKQGAIYPCFDTETEIMTEDGWLSIQDLEDEKVATLNELGNMEYNQPYQKQNYDYEGDLLHFDGKMVDLLVTPNHSMYCKTRFHPFQLTEAKNIFGKYNVEFLTGVKAYQGKNNPKFFEIPLCDTYNGRTKGITKFKIIPWLKFLGWFLSEGCAIKSNGYRISIAQDKQQNIPEIVKCVDDLGFKPYLSRWGTAVVFSSKELYYYLKQFGYSKERFIPTEIKTLSPNLLTHLIETMMKGDGSNGEVYYTSSLPLADDFQEILLKIGYASTIYPIRNQYAVTVAKRNHTPQVYPKHQIKLAYKGKVHDVTVKNHIILVRRNGRAVWSGNCFNFRMSDLQALLGSITLKTLYDQLLRTKVNADHLINSVKEYWTHEEPTEGIHPSNYIIALKPSGPSDITTTIDKIQTKFGDSQPRMAVSRGYQKMLTDLTICQKYPRTNLANTYQLKDQTLWVDWHRWPHTRETMKGVIEILTDVF